MAQENRSRLTLRRARSGQAAVLHICGSATIQEADRMRRTLEALAAGKAPVIVLDLSEMDFICSQGLGAIILGHLKSRHHHGEIRLVNPQPEVRKLLETTRLTKLFAIYPSVEQAAH